MVWYYAPARFKNPSIEKLGSVALIDAPRADRGSVVIIRGSVEYTRLLVVIRGSVDWSEKCVKISMGCWSLGWAGLEGRGSVDPATPCTIYITGRTISFILKQKVNSFCV